MSDRDLMLAQLADMFEEQGDPRAAELRRLAKRSPFQCGELMTLNPSVRTLADQALRECEEALLELGVRRHTRVELMRNGPIREVAYVAHRRYPPLFRDDPDPSPRAERVSYLPMLPLSWGDMNIAFAQEIDTLFVSIVPGPPRSVDHLRRLRGSLLERRRLREIDNLDRIPVDSENSGQ